jgi:protein-S-isoprenylcysteine O-methyltransferase Ste14
LVPGRIVGVMRGLELKVPPVALVFICAGLMWVADASAPRFAFQFQFQFQALVAEAFVFVGMIVSMLGVIEFRRAKTTVNPTKPTSSSSLVEGGIYKWTRNPMYLGFLLVLSGWAVWLGNYVGFAVLPAFVTYMNCFQIRPEERALESIFGEEFARYRSRVRRWI